ncbi:hypothetical protein B1H29_33765 [Streptomyces pactum]|uniref:Uncharacterized protein n=1 Tax=Streptomyces pactum TaxID=68249 RepID=A0A1S6JHG4_9ACTN|nr:hypothetical protein B1H29_33765 [Streptomyces pactum]
MFRPGNRVGLTADYTRAPVPDALVAHRREGRPAYTPPGHRQARGAGPAVREVLGDAVPCRPASGWASRSCAVRAAGWTAGRPGVRGGGPVSEMDHVSRYRFHGARRDGLAFTHTWRRSRPERPSYVTAYGPGWLPPSSQGFFTPARRRPRLRHEIRTGSDVPPRCSGRRERLKWA